MRKFIVSTLAVLAVVSAYADETTEVETAPTTTEVSDASAAE